jgi:hypothetical protein
VRAAGFDHGHGSAVQVDPIKPTLKLPGTKRLKLKCDAPLSFFAFKFNLRRYTTAGAAAGAADGKVCYLLLRVHTQSTMFPLAQRGQRAPTPGQRAQPPGGGGEGGGGDGAGGGRGQSPITDPRPFTCHMSPHRAERVETRIETACLQGLN